MPRIDFQIRIGHVLAVLAFVGSTSLGLFQIGEWSQQIIDTVRQETSIRSQQFLTLHSDYRSLSQQVRELTYELAVLTDKSLQSTMPHDRLPSFARPQ